MIKSSSTIIFFDKHRFVAIHSWFENEVINSLLNHDYFFKIQIYFPTRSQHADGKYAQNFFFYYFFIYKKNEEKK